MPMSKSLNNPSLSIKTATHSIPLNNPTPSLEPHITLGLLSALSHVACCSYHMIYQYGVGVCPGSGEDISKPVSTAALL